MLRMGMTALVMLLGPATAVAAERPSDLSAGGAVLGARQHNEASIAKAGPSVDTLPAPRLRVDDTLSLTPSTIRGVGLADHSTPKAPSAPARALAQASAPDLSHHPAWLDSDSDDASLAYIFNDTLSLGLGYRLTTDETLGFKVAKAGAVDPGYTNHRVLLRAHWQF
jgi:hypothetical protein